MIYAERRRQIWQKSAVKVTEGNIDFMHIKYNFVNIIQFICLQIVLKFLVEMGGGGVGEAQEHGRILICLQRK